MTLSWLVIGSSFYKTCLTSFVELLNRLFEGPCDASTHPVQLVKKALKDVLKTP